MRKQFDSASCPTCETSFDRLPVEFDHDGGYVLIPMKSCPECAKLLCPACDQFHCDGCGHTFCADHLVSVPDGTDRPLHCCQACALECELLPFVSPIPPQSERGLPARLEVA